MYHPPKDGPETNGQARPVMRPRNELYVYVTAACVDVSSPVVGQLVAVVRRSVSAATVRPVAVAVLQRCSWSRDVLRASRLPALDVSAPVEL